MQIMLKVVDYKLPVHINQYSSPDTIIEILALKLCPKCFDGLSSFLSLNQRFPASLQYLLSINFNVIVIQRLIYR